MEMELTNMEMNTAYTDLMNRIARVFPSEPSFENGKKYMVGLLSPIERKNGWQMAEYLGETTPYALQQFLYRGRFRSDEIRDVMRDYVGENLGEQEGVLVIGTVKQ